MSQLTNGGSPAFGLGTIFAREDQVTILSVHRLFIFLAYFAAMCFSAGHAFAQESTSRTPWHVKGGLLEVSRESIVFEQKKQNPIPIKTASVTSVCYDTSAHARGPSVGQATIEMGMGDARSLIFAPFVLPVVAGIHASKVTRHLVTVHWRPEQSGEDVSYPSALTVEAGKRNYLLLLKELQQVTGKSWTDVSKRRNELLGHISHRQKRVQRGKDGVFDLVVRQRSRVGNSILDPYVYAAALQSNGSGDGNLYLFEGVTKQLKLAALIHVSMKDEKNTVSEIIPSYEVSEDQNTDGGLPVATGIRMPSRTLEISQPQPYDYDAECPVLP